MNFEPNWASPPGDTVARLMSASGLSQLELADQIGLDDNSIDSLLNGQLAISRDIAEALAVVLGASPEFWQERYDQYISDQARLSEEKQKTNDLSWARDFPVRSLKEFGWIPKDSRGEETKSDLLAFFGTTSIREWRSKYSSGIGEVAFRTSFAHETDENATLAWLRSGEMQLQQLDLPAYDAKEFVEILPQLKRLCALKHPYLYLPRVQTMCAKAGVGVATSRSLTGCRASGASWFTPEGNPQILLSFRHMSEDHFWFTFFHEAAHAILHQDTHINLDGTEPSPLGEKDRETEANEFAQKVLIPDYFREFVFESSPSQKHVRAIARRCSVTPGIIVGQLQKEGLVKQNQLNFLKRRYKWSSNPTTPVLYQPRKRTY